MSNVCAENISTKFYTDNLKFFFPVTMTERVAVLREHVHKCFQLSSKIITTKKMLATLWKLMKVFFITCTYF
jgi:hypothetical protein